MMKRSANFQVSQMKNVTGAARTRFGPVRAVTTSKNDRIKSLNPYSYHRNTILKIVNQSDEGVVGTRSDG